MTTPTKFWKPRLGNVFPNSFGVTQIECVFITGGWEELVPFRGFGVGDVYPDNFQVGRDIFETEQEALLFVKKHLDESKRILEAQLAAITQRLEELK